MADLQTLFQVIDGLPPEDLERLYHYIRQRHQTTWGIVPVENLSKIDKAMRPVQDEASQMPEDEVNTAIDRAIGEVRRERKAEGRD
jgi:hypothetical protein